MKFDLFNYFQQDAVLDLTDCLPVRGLCCLERPELGKAPWETGEAALDVLNNETFHSHLIVGNSFDHISMICQFISFETSLGTTNMIQKFSHSNIWASLGQHFTNR